MSTQIGKKLGLLVCKPEAIQRLSEPLESCGWTISQSVVLAHDQIVTGLFEGASALVVDLDGANNSQLQHLNELVSAEVRPVLFSDSSHDQDWQQHLHIKLTDLLRKVELHIDIKPLDKVVGDDGVREPAIKSDSDIADVSIMSGNVWLLNSSLGGPEALREFFSTLSSGLPISFIVTQRVAKEHIKVLVNHLEQYTDYSISVMNKPTVLCDGTLILVADGSCFAIDNKNTLLPDTTSLHERAYDQMMTQLAERYGVNANVIVFSAIGEDGTKGCQKVLASGGRVWLQKGQVSYASRLAQQPRDEAHHNKQRFEAASAIELAQRLNDLYKH